MNKGPNKQVPHTVESTLRLPPRVTEPRNLVLQLEAAIGDKAQLPPQLLAPTREDIARNNKRLKALPRNLQGIESFLPELKKKTASDVLRILSDRYTANPNPTNASALQFAVNRITTCAPIDSQMKYAITKAVEVLYVRSASYGYTGQPEKANEQGSKRASTSHR